MYVPKAFAVSWLSFKAECHRRIHRIPSQVEVFCDAAGNVPVRYFGVVGQHSPAQFFQHIHCVGNEVFVCFVASHNAFSKISANTLSFCRWYLIRLCCLRSPSGNSAHLFLAFAAILSRYFSR